MRAQDAVRRLIGKIEEQASLNGVELSKLESRMLRWSEIEPEGAHDSAINEQFETEYDTDDFETKIAKLIKQAYQRDSASGNKSEWDEINSSLRTNDYYVLVMLEQAIPSFSTTTTPGQLAMDRPSSLRDYVVYFGIALAIVGAVVAVALITEK